MAFTFTNLISTILLCLFAGQAIAKPLGSSCTSRNDCDGTMICTSGLCSELSSTKTCSWVPHGIGASCTRNSDCSDNDVCSANHVCVDQYAKTKQPYIVFGGCWNNTYWVSAPEGCKGGHCPSGWVTQWMVEVKGEHFNTGNVQVQITSGPTVLSSQTVTAVAGKPGKAAGSFDVKTYVECPARHKGVGIVVTDGCTGKITKASYPAE